jgi:hypothetical protein
VRDAAELVDKMAKMELDEIVGVRLDDLERKYASLPIKKGGLGISSYSDIGWSAYFSSLVEAAQCFKDVGIWEEETSMDHHWIIEASKDEIQELVQMIAELRQGQVEDKRGEGVLFPLSMQELISTVPKAQKRLTALIHTRNEKEVMRGWQASGHEQFYRTVHSSNTNWGASAFLRAIPTEDKLFMSDMEMRHALALRLTLEPPFEVPEKCACDKGVRMESKFDTHHINHCGKLGQQTEIHDEINRTFASVLRTAGVHRRMEVRAAHIMPLLPQGEADEERYMDLVEMGARIAYDTTIVHPLAQTNMATSEGKAEVLMAHAANIKNRKLKNRCNVNGFTFYPLVMDKLGAMHDGVRMFLKRAADMDSAQEIRANYSAGNFEAYWTQVLSCRLHVMLARGAWVLTREAKKRGGVLMSERVTEDWQVHNWDQRRWMQMSNI